MNQLDLHSDKYLLMEVVQGDQRSFEIIYHKYAAPLYRFARKNIALKEDCEEIIQDIFMDIWARREKLDDVANLQSYLYRMVRYKVIRYFQHKGAIKRFEEHYRLFEVLYEDPQLEENKNATFQERLTTCLTNLPERCQEAFRLRLLENLSNPEVAQRMNISKKTVQLYMSKALCHIRASGKKQFLKLG